MANRFYLPTGISSKPIDIAGAGQRLMGAAVEQKLADIDQGRAIADESQKAALEAMSMKSIQGLDRQLQERYEKDFDAHQAEIRDMLSKGGGVLTRPQQMAIKNKQEDIINRTMADNVAMQARNKVREFMLDPNTQYGYNIDAIANELAQWDESFKKGEYTGDPRTILFKHQVEAPVSGYISKRYNDAIDQLDVEALGDFTGNVFTETELTGLNVQAQESVDKARRLRDVIMQDPNVLNRYVNPDGTENLEAKAEIQQQIEDAISRKISETKPYRQSTSGTGTTRQLRELSPKKVELASGEYTDYVDYPASQSEKRFTINRALNEETGREDTFDTAQSMRVIGFDPTANKVFFVSKGGEKKVNGNRVFNIGTKELTEEDIAGGNPKVFTELAKNSKFEGADNATRVTGVEVIDNEDGTFTLKGTVEKWRKKGISPIGIDIRKGMVSEDNLNTDKHVLDDSEEVSVTIKPVMDEKATTRYSAPLSEYEEVVSELYQYGIGGHRVRDYYKSQIGKQKKDSLGIL